jgi:hypothetical protein
MVYKRLSSHPNIAKLLEIRTDGSIILERGMPLRSISRGPSANEIPIEQKIRWLRQAAEGYTYLHAQGSSVTQSAPSDDSSSEFFSAEERLTPP